MDPTHKTEIWPHDISVWGWDWDVRSFYGQPNDSLLAWRKA